MKNKPLKPTATVANFQATANIALEPGDVYLEPSGLVSKSRPHTLALKRTKTELVIVCEPRSYRAAHWITASVGASALAGMTIGAVVGAEFARPGVAFLLLLSVLTTAAFAYGLTWLDNKNIAENHPLLVFDSRSNTLSTQNGRHEIGRSDVLCFMLMNSRSRQGRAETTVFQLKVVTKSLNKNHHNAIVLLQNGSIPLERYHEQLVPFARALKLPLVQCEYDFREFHLTRLV